MKVSIRERLRQAKRRVERRLERGGGGARPMFAASAIRYELANKMRGVGVGGIGLVHRLVQETGLAEAIDRHVHVLKIHLPYHESDHVLNLAYNALCDGVRLVNRSGNRPSHEGAAEEADQAASIETGQTNRTPSLV